MYVTFGFQFMNIIFLVMFLIVIILFVVAFVKGIKTWNNNNHSPRLDVDVIVAAKRQDVSHTRHANAGDMTGAHGFHSTSHTTYYVTFQVNSGDRMEFEVDGNEYGILAEGDIGKLHFQGTRYLGFERNQVL